MQSKVVISPVVHLVVHHLVVLRLVVLLPRRRQRRPHPQPQHQAVSPILSFIALLALLPPLFLLFLTKRDSAH